MPLSIEALAAQLAGLESGYRQTDLMRALTEVGVSASFASLQEVAVQDAVVSSPDLADRFQDALAQVGRSSWLSTSVPPANDVIPLPWAETVQRRFRVTDVCPPLVFSSLWRDVRSLAEGPLWRRTPEEAARLWAASLERQGLGRVGETMEAASRHATQILRWLGIRTLPEGRRPRRLEPTSLGFRQVYKKAPALGDLVIPLEPLFAGAGILTGVDASQRPAEALFILGGRVFLGAPSLIGGFPDFWRPGPKTPDYLIVPRDPFPDREGALLPVLDELLEASEGIRFGTPHFREVHRSQGAGIGGTEWVTAVDFENRDFAIFHLEVAGSAVGGGATRRLVVVVDYYSRTGELLRDFLKEAETVLLERARSLGFERLDIFYKMIMPFLPDRGERAVLDAEGYSKKNHPGWGRLPAKTFTLQSTRR